MNKNTLVDLDETLALKLKRMAPDFTFPVRFNNETHVVNVHIRPYLEEFMKQRLEEFEVVIFGKSKSVRG